MTSKNQNSIGSSDCPPDLIQLQIDPLKNPGIPNLDILPDPDLVAKGWERRFMADPNRLQESTAIYKELGYEIHIEPVKPEELSTVCGDCRLVACSAFSTIYTRRKPNR